MKLFIFLLLLNSVSGNIYPGIERQFTRSLDYTLNSLFNKASDSNLFHYRIIRITSYFGYDIIAHGKVIIHQPHIPGISGNKAFKTKEDAQKTARLVIYKVNKNIIGYSIRKR